MTEQEIENKLLFMESLFEKSGAIAQDINEKNREKFGQRQTYKYGDSYYRIEALNFEESGEPYMVISCTDDEKCAQIGLMEDVEALTFDMTDEELEWQVRCVFGIESYPEEEN